MPAIYYLIIYLSLSSLVFADLPRNLVKKSREDFNKLNGAISTASVIAANSPSIFENLLEVGTKGKGRYDRMSISGKDYVVFNFDHQVGDYSEFAKTKMLENAGLSQVDAVGVIGHRDKFYANGFDVKFMKNLSHSWDGGFGLGVNYVRYDDLKIPFVLDAVKGTYVDKRSGIGLSFGGSLQYNLSLYEKDNYRGSFFTSLSGGLSYIKINIEESLSTDLGGAKAPALNKSDVSFYAGISFGSELWFHSFCFVPKVSLDDEFETSYGVTLHKILGFYDTIFLGYSTGDDDFGDWHSLKLGTLITIM